MPEGSPLSEKELFEKLGRYCAYRERAVSEVRTKLASLTDDRTAIEHVVEALVRERMVDDGRFARVYARSKHRHNQWGRVRIRLELARRHVDDAHIEDGLAELDEDDYLATLEDLVERNLRRWTGRDAFARRGKAQAFLRRKGYEAHLVHDVLDRHLPLD